MKLYNLSDEPVWLHKRLGIAPHSWAEISQVEAQGVSVQILISKGVLSLEAPAEKLPVKKLSVEKPPVEKPLVENLPYEVGIGNIAGIHKLNLEIPKKRKGK